ncbi:MAG: YdcF family protein [Tissierellia bacterium]|nr:YdcF family protein [Tissierellia bacterium]
MKSVVELTDFLFMQSELSPSDVLFLPGSLSFQTVELAAQLYHQGLAPLIIPSGGHGKIKGRFEWEKIKKEEYRKPFDCEYDYMEFILLERGVPQSAILREDRATYTYQNAQYSKALLDERGIQPKKAILCVKDYHARRSFMYYDLVFPEVELLIAPARIEVAAKDRWHLTELGVRTILGEYRKIGEQFYGTYLEAWGIDRE